MYGADADAQSGEGPLQTPQAQALRGRLRPTHLRLAARPTESHGHQRRCLVRGRRSHRGGTAGGEARGGSGDTGWRSTGSARSVPASNGRRHTPQNPSPSKPPRASVGCPLHPEKPVRPWLITRLRLTWCGTSSATRFMRWSRPRRGSRLPSLPSPAASTMTAPLAGCPSWPTPSEAGCNDKKILAHCRGPGPHVRGCWVVDLILGKE